MIDLKSLTIEKTHQAFMLKKEGIIKEEPKKEAAKQEEKK